MSFGAGLGAGIGSGIAIGVPTGKKQACQQIREYAKTNALTIHDALGAEVDIETVLSKAVLDRSLEQPSNKILLTILLLLGVAMLGVLSFLLFR
jgi:hypothetical protein